MTGTTITPYLFFGGRCEEALEFYGKALGAEVEMLMRLGDASRYLSDALARQPELFDGIVRGALLSDPKTLARMCEELCATGVDGLDPMEAARRWKRRKTWAWDEPYEFRQTDFPDRPHHCGESRNSKPETRN